MRRGPTKSNCTDKLSADASPTSKNINEVSSQFSQLNNKRSTTATMEGLVSLSYCPPAEQQQPNETHLASEEDISNESDSLLQYGLIEDGVKANELNGTTYL